MWFSRFFLFILFLLLLFFFCAVLLRGFWSVTCLQFYNPVYEIIYLKYEFYTFPLKALFGF